MEDETATGFEDVTPDANAQTDTDTSQTAENDQTEVQTDQETETEATSEDDEYLEWASKKGVNLDDKRAVAKMLREADRKVSETTLKAKTTLQEAVSSANAPASDDDVVTELQKQNAITRSQLAVVQHYLNNPEDKALDGKAHQLLQELVVADPELARGLGRNLPALFALIKQQNTEDELAKAEEKGRKEERRSLAGKQRAAATSQAATSSAPAGDKDPFEVGFDNPWK